MAPATSSSPAAASQLNVVFDGTWIFFPSTDESGNIVGIDVYSPHCGPPPAALFLPQLGPFGPDNWPPLDTFYLIDNHGLTLFIEGPGTGMPASGIDTTINHCIPKKRPLAGNWDVIVS